MDRGGGVNITVSGRKLVSILLVQSIDYCTST